MSKSQDSICTLYIKLASIDAIGDLLYQLDGTGDITAIDKGTLLGAATIIQDLAAECKEAVVELESICHTKDKEVTSDDFKEVDGVWTYKGFPVSEVEKLDQESIDIALQYQGFSEENKTRASTEIDRVEVEYGKGITDTPHATQEETGKPSGRAAIVSLPNNGKSKKLSQESVDLALQIQSMDEEARNNAIASIDAIKIRSARGDDLKLQDYDHSAVNNLDVLYKLAARFDALGDILSACDDEGEVCIQTISTLGMMMMDMSNEMGDAIHAIDGSVRSGS